MIAYLDSHHLSGLAITLIDKRISGSCASLAGLEKAEAAGDAAAIDRAVDRILMGHALIASHGGLPLIYMGDEIALLNDYGYHDYGPHAHDSRWLHRPIMDWERVDSMAADPDSAPARVFSGLRAILAARAETPEFHAKNPTEVLRTGNSVLFAFARRAPTGSVICVFNFSDTWQTLPQAWVAQHGASQMHDILSDAPVGDANGAIPLPPYARVWIR